ncbi:hypothetical protein [Bifidobacterium parmae]|uniref:Uncharacterized protein n=1 Tax=Bifidobacterium parmae TaxID=361854 RepID=A0A2N5J0Q3_9BIFI|nr:hypothetical protein [Bifidobacterium parmae]PLS27795.1 hypothetical protein Uis4E_1368 [Bifidobacterium parmae]
MSRRTVMIAVVSVVAAIAMLGVGMLIGYNVEAWKASHVSAGGESAQTSGNAGQSGDSGSGDSSGSDGSGGSGDSASKAMFKEVAGNYSWSSSAISRTNLTLRSDGTFNAAYTVADDENTAHLNTDTPSTTVNVTGRFSSIRKTDTGYTLQCDAKSLKVAGSGTDKDTDKTKKGSGMAPCGTWRWYSGGTTLEEVRDATGAWGVGGLDPSRKAVVLAADHGSGALFLRMS